MESVARSISGAINGYKVVVEKSTVPVYTSDWVRKLFCEMGQRLKLSMSLLILSFCAKARQSRIFSIPTALWLERTANAVLQCCARFMLPCRRHLLHKTGRYSRRLIAHRFRRR